MSHCLITAQSLPHRVCRFFHTAESMLSSFLRRPDRTTWTSREGLSCVQTRWHTQTRTLAYPDPKKRDWPTPTLRQGLQHIQTRFLPWRDPCGGPFGLPQGSIRLAVMMGDTAGGTPQHHTLSSISHTPYTPGCNLSSLGSMAARPPSATGSSSAPSPPPPPPPPVAPAFAAASQPVSPAARVWCQCGSAAVSPG
jgi:hypothetical protein